MAVTYQNLITVKIVTNLIPGQMNRCMKLDVSSEELL